MTPSTQSNISKYIYTYGAFAVMAASGLVINTSIISRYDADTLGVFNQVYALFVVYSQVAGLGIQYSVLRNSTKYESYPDQLSKCVWSSCLSSVLCAVPAVLVLYFLSDIIGLAFDSQPLAESVPVIVPAIVLFCLNKNFINVLNGLQYYRLYAVAQCLRFSVLVIYVFVISLLRYNPVALPFAFLVSESVLFLFLQFFMNRIVPFGFASLSWVWVKNHLAFGFKGFMTGVFLEINVRVDVLMLGLFCSDYLVGVYSLASMFFEGINSVTAVIRTITNPKIVHVVAASKGSDVGVLFRRSGGLALLASGLLIAAVLFCFKNYGGIFVEVEQLVPAYEVLFILCCGAFIYSAFSPFVMVFTQVGRPDIQTLFFFLVTLTNIIFNLLLIPFYDIYGAAIATSMSFSLCGVLLLTMSSKYLSLQLGKGLLPFYSKSREE